MKSLITIDVEGSSGPDRYDSVRRLDDVLRKINKPTTLFVTPDVVQTNPELMKNWREDGHSLGLHTHPSRHPEGDSDWLTDYSTAEIEQFLDRGCSVFNYHLDMRPIAFRAGRWEYSEELLQALSTNGFKWDSSLRQNRHHDPFSHHGVNELPMTVYSNHLIRILLKPWGATRIPLHADGFLSPSYIVPGFYAITYRLIHSNRDYLMISFHDYDILEETLRQRIEHYITFVADRTSITTIDRL